MFLSSSSSRIPLKASVLLLIVSLLVTLAGDTMINRVDVYAQKSSTVTATSVFASGSAVPTGQIRFDAGNFEAIAVDMQGEQFVSRGLLCCSRHVLHPTTRMPVHFFIRI